MIDGWVSLSRRVTEWEWYSDTNVVRLFFHVLLMANFRDTTWMGITIKRGQFVSSRERISQQINLTVKQIRTAEKKLEASESLGVEGANRFTIYTVVKYDEYQNANPERASKGQAKGKQRASKGQQLNKDNKDNNENNLEDYPLTPLPEWMPRDAWEAFKEMRRRIKKPLTEEGGILAIAKLDSWRAKGHDITEIINNSIMNSWQGLFEPKEERHENSRRNTNANNGNADQQGQSIGKSKWELAAEQLLAEDAATGRWKDRK